MGYDTLQIKWILSGDNTHKISAFQLKWLKSYCHVHIHIEAFQPIQVMFCSTFIASQHPFMFKYQVDKQIPRTGDTESIDRCGQQHQYLFSPCFHFQHYGALNSSSFTSHSQKQCSITFSTIQHYSVPVSLPTAIQNSVLSKQQGSMPTARNVFQHYSALFTNSFTSHNQE